MGEEYGGYRMIMTGPDPDELAGRTIKMEEIGINGGMMKREAPRPEDGKSPNAYTCVIGVDDIDAYIAKADAAGAVPQTDKTDVPGIGQVRYYKDTEGNIFAMIQPAEMPAK